MNRKDYLILAQGAWLFSGAKSVTPLFGDRHQFSRTTRLQTLALNLKREKWLTVPSEINPPFKDSVSNEPLRNCTGRPGASEREKNPITGTINCGTRRGRLSASIGMTHQPIAPGRTADCQPRRSGNTRLVAVVVATHGAIKTPIATVPIMGLDLGMKRPWGSTHSERRRKVSMTWLEMCGKGWLTGSIRLTTQRSLRMSQQWPPKGRRNQQTCGSCAAGRRSSIQRACGRRTATGTNLTTRALALGSGVPGKFLPL